MDKVDRDLPVMLAVNTGLEREGVRDTGAAQRIATRLAGHPRVRLAGLYTHEGQFYGKDPAQRHEEVDQMLGQLEAVRDAIDPSLALWPGCSVTGRHIAENFSDRVQAVRPGAYLFGDLSLTVRTGIMPFEQVALQVLATVVDKPTDDLALIDAGTKTFSSDRTPQGLSGIAADGRDLQVVGVNEEHGYVRGADVANVRVGERVAFVPAHVCTVVNLNDRVQVLDDDGQIVATWPVDARGRIQ
jgi:D-serine deaminase-like pyridoxal phosphate-dependent protein